MVGNSCNLTTTESNKLLIQWDNTLRKVNLSFKHDFIALKLAKNFAVIHFPLGRYLPLKPRTTNVKRDGKIAVRWLLEPRGLRETRKTSILRSLSILDVPVTSVSERCDNKAATVAQILIPIVDTSSYHPHYCLLLLKVIPELWQPLEIISAVYLILVHLCNYITSWQIQILTMITEILKRVTCNLQGTCRYMKRL